MASSPDFEYSPDELNELLTAVMPDIPGYRVMRLLGRGGMSFVYLGVQESLDRQVAIKVIRPDALKDEVSKMRFEKEARTIAKLQHPCIVGIHEVGRTEQGLLFYVMPYLAKGHLGERRITGDQERITAVLHALLWALDYAHLRGMVHRDVKAENVLFDNADRPVLTDFGIALNKRERSRITGTGFAVGSGDYMAPEQARGESVDGRADLYALGVLTYELLTGDLPYKHDDPLGLALMHAIDPIPRLPDALKHWQRFIDKAMAKSRDDRFADAQEMMAALEDVEAAYAKEHRADHALAEGTNGVTTARHAPSSLLTRIPAGWRKPVLAGLVGLVIVAAIAALRPSPATTEETATLAEPPTQTVPSPTPSGESAAAPASAAVTPEAATPADSLIAEASFEPGADEAAEEQPALPEAPGLRELALAQRQIAQHRLTQPPGDNALQSLLDARRLVPDAPGLAATGERWLDTATPYVRRALSESNIDSARALYASAKRLADGLGLRESPAWQSLERSVVTPFKARLEANLAAKDLEALRDTKAEAEAMGIESAMLEPLWSRPIVVARRGDVLDRGLPMVLAGLPRAGQTGLATMAQAVTRAEFAAFVTATGHQPASCRIRTALMTLRKRSWNDPGFDQGNGHPVVCVSVADATAFAAWRSAQDGVDYRLPTTAEWRSLADYPGFAEACQAQRIACAGKGTAAADAGPLATPGVRAMHGNVREWPADCGPNCREHPTLGASWRDTTAGSTGDASVDARYGYDDVGFRLVRDVAKDELERK